MVTLLAALDATGEQAAPPAAHRAMEVALQAAASCDADVCPAAPPAARRVSKWWPPLDGPQPALGILVDAFAVAAAASHPKVVQEEEEEEGRGVEAVREGKVVQPVLGGAATAADAAATQGTQPVQAIWHESGSSLLKAYFPTPPGAAGLLPVARISDALAGAMWNTLRDVRCTPGAGDPSRVTDAGAECPVPGVTSPAQVVKFAVDYIELLVPQVCGVAYGYHGGFVGLLCMCSCQFMSTFITCSESWLSMRVFCVPATCRACAVDAPPTLAHAQGPDNDPAVTIVVAGRRTRLGAPARSCSSWAPWCAMLWQPPAAARCAGTWTQRARRSAASALLRR